ncbi:hypothetical protein NE237_004257 [Protea cynaroides]|uniref:Uncharacterized protein n=1 Tax=Protea cynaroides TaxID=273540 RepID=A0A9Q0QTD4_9MAGN|nr:hypothetical protein NE237_004257 [Protea cynaroides]
MVVVVDDPQSLENKKVAIGDAVPRKLQVGLRIHLSILREPEPAEELAAATLHTVPHIILLFHLFAPLPTDLKDASLLHLHLLFFLLEPRKVSLGDVGFRSLFPIDSGVKECFGIASARSPEWIPIAKREWVEQIGSLATKDAWNQTSCRFSSN